MAVGRLVDEPFDGFKARINFDVIDLQDQGGVATVNGGKHSVNGLPVRAIGEGDLVCNGLVLRGSVAADEVHRRLQVHAGLVEALSHFGAGLQPVLALQRFFCGNGGSR